MLVTRETEHAVRIGFYPARNDSRLTSVTETAYAMHTPKSFLAKLLRRLLRSCPSMSSRGVNGGFQLAIKPVKMTLLFIKEAVQGPAGINVRAIDSRQCRMSTARAVQAVAVELLRRSQSDRIGNDCQVYPQIAVPFVYRSSALRNWRDKRCHPES